MPYPNRPRQSGRKKKQTDITNIGHPAPSTKNQSKPKSSNGSSTSSSSSSDNEEKKTFIKELAESWQLEGEYIKKYLIENDYTFSGARGIMKDFTELLKKESIKSGANEDRGIYCGIKTNCTKNLEYDIHYKKNICFCCGEPIYLDADKACDHVIPIITLSLIHI